MKEPTDSSCLLDYCPYLKRQLVPSRNVQALQGIASKLGVSSNAKALALASEQGAVMFGLLKLVGCIASKLGVSV